MRSEFTEDSKFDEKFFSIYPRCNYMFSRCQGDLIRSSVSANDFSINCVQYREGTEFTFLDFSQSVILDYVDSADTENENILEYQLSCKDKFFKRISSKTIRVAPHSTIDGQSLWIFRLKLSENVVQSDLKSLNAFLFLKGLGIGVNQTLRILPIRDEFFEYVGEILNSSICDVSESKNILRTERFFNSDCATESHIFIMHENGWVATNISTIFSCQVPLKRDALYVNFLLTTASIHYSDTQYANNHDLVIPISASDWFTAFSAENAPKFLLFTKSV
jgi:hypothetical protein